MSPIDIKQPSNFFLMVCLAKNPLNPGSFFNKLLTTDS